MRVLSHRHKYSRGPPKRWSFKVTSLASHSTYGYPSLCWEVVMLYTTAQGPIYWKRMQTQGPHAIPTHIQQSADEACHSLSREAAQSLFNACPLKSTSPTRRLGPSHVFLPLVFVLCLGKFTLKGRSYHCLGQDVNCN
ncbi:hypothetical protein VNO77_22687 [Canavalia gladiata]|uniref:Uncharacterized protein n=1 Tax=Canavalia gladiata TaxID=3824 RepID=A0AAN9L318_CANGL